jgi:hypothetical protein
MNGSIPRLIRAMEGDSQLVGSEMSAHMPVLYLLARDMGAHQAVECGVYRAWSTLSILLGVADGGGTLTSYDNHPDPKWARLEFATRKGGHPTVGPDDPLRERWTFHNKEFASSAADWPDGSVHLLLQDTSHELEPTRAELQAWLPKMAPEGIMCGHDYWLHEHPDPKWKDIARVKQAVDEFALENKDRFQLQTMKPDCGFWILWPRQA